MKFFDTDIKGLKVIEPGFNSDERGYFMESFHDKKFRDQGMGPFVQDNESYSVFGVIRGLHYQLPPYAQGKLVRVMHGKVIDVAVDIRKNSPSFGKSFNIELSGENKKQLYIPRGFAHGFSVLSERAVVLYKCDDYYRPESEAGIIYNDPALKIDWNLDPGTMIVSEKDKRLPTLANCKNSFVFEG